MSFSKFFTYILVPVKKLTIKPAENNNVTNVVNGEIKIFTCTTDKSRPAALIQWYISSKNVTSGSHLQATQDGDKFVSISKLNYTGIDKDHNETIFCEAFNIIGQAKVSSKKRSIYIQCKYNAVKTFFRLNYVYIILLTLVLSVPCLGMEIWRI